MLFIRNYHRLLKYYFTVHILKQMKNILFHAETELLTYKLKLITGRLHVIQCARKKH